MALILRIFVSICINIPISFVALWTSGLVWLTMFGENAEVSKNLIGIALNSEPSGLWIIMAYLVGICIFLISVGMMVGLAGALWVLVWKKDLTEEI